jgi:hypothetical protein
MFAVLSLVVNVVLDRAMEACRGSEVTAAHIPNLGTVAWASGQVDLPAAVPLGRPR